MYTFVLICMFLTLWNHGESYKCGYKAYPKELLGVLANDDLDHRSKLFNGIKPRKQPVLGWTYFISEQLLFLTRQRLSLTITKSCDDDLIIYLRDDSNVLSVLISVVEFVSFYMEFDMGVNITGRVSTDTMTVFISDSGQLFSCSFLISKELFNMNNFSTLEYLIYIDARHYPKKIIYDAKATRDKLFSMEAVLTPKIMSKRPDFFLFYDKLKNMAYIENFNYLPNVTAYLQVPDQGSDFTIEYMNNSDVKNLVIKQQDKMVLDLSFQCNEEGYFFNQNKFALKCSNNSFYQDLDFIDKRKTFILKVRIHHSTENKLDMNEDSIIRPPGYNKNDYKTYYMTLYKPYSIDIVMQVLSTSVNKKKFLKWDVSSIKSLVFGWFKGYYEEEGGIFGKGNLCWFSTIDH